MNVSTHNIGERLQEIRVELGLTQEEMGALIEKGKGSVSKYEKGDAEPSYATLEKYVSASGKSFDWIFTGKRQIEIECATEAEQMYGHYADDLQYVKVPRFAVAASAGGGATVESEQIVDYLMFDKTWVTTTLGANPNRVALISVIGDSMSPTYNDGDLILVDTSSGRPKSDGVYVMQHDCCLWVKRLHFQFDGSISVISDNPRYPEQSITGEALERLRIVGRVIWRGGR